MESLSRLVDARLVVAEEASDPRDVEVDPLLWAAADAAPIPAARARARQQRPAEREAGMRFMAAL